MGEWISIEDELIIDSRNVLRATFGFLRAGEAKDRAKQILEELETYIQENGLDFTKEKTE